MADSYTVKAFAAGIAESSLAPYTIPRRVPEAPDVQIGILYCGVCHADLEAMQRVRCAFDPEAPSHASGGTDMCFIGPTVITCQLTTAPMSFRTNSVTVSWISSKLP